MRRYLTEFIGTLFFVLTIGLVVTPGHETPLAPLVIGSVLMVLVYMGGHVSGAHYNPAVTLAIYLRKKLAARDLVPYWAAQLLGALVGAYLSYIFLDRTFAPAPGLAATPVTALLVEMLYTFLLALTVLNVATSKDTQGNSFYGIAIGFTIVIAVFAGGPISGGVFNPAIGTGTILIKALSGGGSLSHLWLYLVGPFAGGALAAVVFKVQEGAA
jgi:aquaporin Z